MIKQLPIHPNKFPFLRWITLGIGLSLSLSTLLVQAAGADGVFGDYFTRMVGGCASGYSITGFDSTIWATYGAKQCTSVQTIIAGMFWGSSAPAGQGMLGFNSDGSLKFGIASQWSGTTPGDIYYNGGNVGIGTASPTQKLDVSGNIRSAGEIISTNANQFRMVQGNYWVFWRNDGTNTYLLVTNSSNQYGTWNALRPFTINNTTGDASIGNTLYVQHGANVGIGIWAPTDKLDVNGYVRIRSTNGEGGTIRLDGNNGTISYIENINGTFRLINSWWTAELFKVDQGGNTSVAGTLTINGAGWVTSPAYYYSSDKNLKTNITPLNNALEKITSLSGYTFEWKNTGRKDIGVIAQEVEKVFPEIVSKNPSTGYKTVEYGNLVAPLIEAVKEQQKQLDEQKQLIEKLQKEIQTLK